MKANPTARRGWRMPVWPSGNFVCGSFVCVCIGLLAFVLGCRENNDRLTSAYPQRPIKVVVPFSAGGGTDTFARTVQQAIQENQLLPQPLVILNVPGAGGTIGSHRVLQSRPDGYTVLCLHEGILTAKYSHQVAYGPEAFEAIAGTGWTPLVICVGDDSAYRSLADLMHDAAMRPETVVFSASIGAPSHFVGLMLEQSQPGALFRYTQTGGGAKRFAAIKGGHVDVSAFSLAEYSQFRSAGLRALAICSERRHPDAAQVPTAIEQGFDCVSASTQYWWAPKGTDPQRIATVATAIEQAMLQPSVIERLKLMKTDPLVLKGKRLRDDLQRRAERFESVSQRPTIALPNVPAIVGVAILGLIVAVVISERKTKAASRNGQSDLHSRPELLTQRDSQTKSGSQTQPDSQTQPGSPSGPIAGAANTPALVACAAWVVVYVGALQYRWFDFRISTAAFVAGMGMLLLLRGPTARVGVKSIGLIGFAIALSVGLHALFTGLLVLDLP